MCTVAKSCCVFKDDRYIHTRNLSEVLECMRETIIDSLIYYSRVVQVEVGCDGWLLVVVPACKWLSREKAGM